MQLEIEYHGGITSCNKVENYLQYSEYEYNESGNSEVSSQVHSEQVTENDTKSTTPDKSIFQITAPLKKKAGKGYSGINHSLSEPDLAVPAGGRRAGEESAHGGESEEEEGGRVAMDQVCRGEYGWGVRGGSQSYPTFY